MKPNKLVKLAICLLTIVTLNSGCQSGLIKKPELGRLAFWKNDNLRLAAKSNDIPPPSAHFSPDSSSQGSASKDEMKANIDQIIANAKSGKADASKMIDSKMSEAKMIESKIAEAKSTDPIRKPYSLDSINPNLNDRKTEKQSNDFVLNDKVKSFQAATTNTFNAAKNKISQTTNSIKESNNSFVGWQNTLQQSDTNPINTVAQQINSQAKSAVASTSDSLKQFSAAAGDSLNKTVSSVSNSLDNSFQSAANKQVIKNPFSSGTQATASASDFVSKYKSAAENTIESAKQGALAIKNEALNNKPLVPNNPIQQSSFNANINKSTAAILQPNTNDKAPATSYPSTGFGSFTPVKNDKETASPVQIPASLLRGTSSFSPGSTRPLRPSQSGN